MSNTSPPIEQQRFARTQTPESPRPVHVPEPAKIPVLLNQMDPSSNDLQTYGVPLDSNFEQYGDSLENPAHKTSNQEDTQSMQAFLDNAANAIANDRDGQFNPNASASASENPNINANASMQYTNYPGTTLSNSLLASNPHFDSAVLQQQAASNGTQHAPAVEQSGPSDSQKESESDDYEPTADQEQKDPEENGQTVHNTNAASGKDAADANSDLKPTPGSGLGVDYQSLLDTITQSASTAPAAENIAAPTTEASLTDTHPSSLPVFPGLPPKPPPLESQSALSASATSDHAHAQQQSLQNADDALFPQHNTANGYLYQTNQQGDTIMTQPLPTNPFEGGMTNEQAVSMHMQQQSQQNLQPRPLTPPDRVETEPADRPWSPKTQAVYDEFLENERRYVTEGIWDRFPIGSRLFVGNLPSEKVTKRDLFHRFHKHGKLAQISIKQAYGFIQFHDSQSCKAALDAEQGVELRGRKVHLEISKPQKGSKSAAQQQPQTNKSQPRRRSRSPVRRPYSDFRDEPSRRREDYRRRSPSPRGYRRDDRGGRDDRRSPIYGSSYSTPQPVYDDEASLPYPRRDPRYVPDVQVIVLEAGVDQAFLNWVEDSLKRKGLSAASTWLNQRTPLPAVVKRQIMEGVQAVVKISATNQMRSKIPLQVFDRSAGTSNVTFNEYVDLDLPVAADIVLQARQRERSVMQPPRPPFPGAFVPPSPYQQQSPNSPWTPQSGAMSQYPPHPPPPTQHYQYPPQSAQPMPQQYRSQQAYPTPSSATSQPPNLHELLANLKGGSGAPPTPQSAHSAGQPFTPYGQPPPPPPQQQQYYAQPQYQQIGPPLPQHQNGTGQQNVQNIMDQLARFQQRQ